MTPTIRLLTLEDTAAYRALRLAALATDPVSFHSYPDEEGAMSEAQFAARLTEPPCEGVFGAFVDGRLLGVAGLVGSPRRKLAHKLTLVGVYVTPDARGQGLARRLAEAAIARAKSLPGITRLLLGVHGTNHAAIALYRSLGFEAYGHEPEAMIVDGQTHDEILMGMSLRP
ncbi:MAG: GNAT family N-acetyltransferase [Paludibacterium sp.]|uniref:GNAT family N-acetyltransferase n=1 Tax=Paludibacterium sp. TaxID=1917523 RepID=UPI0025CDE7A8|nr:GNAT family N-acetyltransferase [Paludibacterium sp.]MBV8049300.1 GNAT family N-acetyltransferase [Paludibacterium sp.]MBV8648431.1 GNAT family N-acetyltransferase [Paludibacterium sp.]